MAAISANPPGFWSQHFCSIIEGEVPYDFNQFQGYARSIIQYRLNGNPLKESLDLDKLARKIHDVYTQYKNEKSLSKRAQMLKEPCFEVLTGAQIDYPQKSKNYLLQRIIPAAFKAIHKDSLLQSETVLNYLHHFYIASVKPETIAFDVEALSDLPEEEVDKMIQTRSNIGVSWYPLVQKREVKKEDVQNLVDCLEKYLENPGFQVTPKSTTFQVVYNEYLEYIKMFPENKRSIALQGVISTIKSFILKNNF